MRDEVMIDLIERGMNDLEFRSRAMDDLEGTLEAYGYELNPEEMAAVKEFHAHTAGMSDEELDRMLSGNTGAGSSQRKRQGS